MLYSVAYWNMFLIAIPILLLISLITLVPSFHLALFGDDWLVFYRYLKDLGPGSTGPYNNFTFFFTPYGSFDVLMGFLRNFYAYNSALYYLTSFFFRMIASFSFLPLIFYLTKNKYAAFFAVLFFSITPVGLDTTNWVFNMPSYVTIALFNLFLFLFFISREQGKGYLFFLSGLLFYLAYVTVPIRMHGSIPLIIVLEIFWLYKNGNLKNVKKTALRLSLFFLIFLFIKSSGHSLGPPEETVDRLKLGLTTGLALLKAGRFDFLFNPLVTLGGTLIPDNLLQTRQISSVEELSITILLPVFFTFLISVKILSKSISLFSKHYWRQVLGFSFFWSLLIIIIYTGNTPSFSSSIYLFLLSIAGYLLFVVCSVIYQYIRIDNISDPLFLGIAWSILSFFFAWWWTPTTIFDTFHRYLIVSSVGIAITLATLLSLSLEKKATFTICFFIAVILTHIYSTRLYLDHLEEVRGQNVTNRIWSQMPSFPNLMNAKSPSFFYFESDDISGDTLHDVITYGFPSHMGLLYKIKSESYLPASLDDFSELSEAVSTGKNLPRFGYPAQPIPINYVYAFRLEGRSNLIDITKQVRQKLTKE